jgi:hypothetical protein
VQAVLSRMLLHPNVVITYDCCTGMMDAARLQVCGGENKKARGEDCASTFDKSMKLASEFESEPQQTLLP